MPHRVVCGYDGSPESTAAARLGAAIGRAVGLDVLLLHVVEQLVDQLESPPNDVRSQLAQQRRDRLVRLCGELGEDATARFEPGDPGAWLLTLAAEQDTDLMLVGTRGHGAAKALALGSVARRVAAEACCPVIVVPPEAAADTRLAELNEALVVCGVDDSPEANGAVAVAAHLAANVNGRLLLAHISEEAPSEEAPGWSSVDAGADLDSDTRARLSLLQEAYEPIVDDVSIQIGLLASPPGSSAETLAWLAEEERAKMIAVGSRGLGALRSVLQGSTSTALVRSAPRPVLIHPRAALPRTAARPTDPQAK